VSPKQRSFALCALGALNCVGGPNGLPCGRCWHTVQSCVASLAQSAIEECEASDSVVAREAAGKFLEDLRRG
jgi:hypothetical protein